MAAFMKCPLWSGSGLGGLTEVGVKPTLVAEKRAVCI